MIFVCAYINKLLFYGTNSTFITHPSLIVPRDHDALSIVATLRVYFRWVQIFWGKKRWIKLSSIEILRRGQMYR
jgi:hypothetical protein